MVLEIIALQSISYTLFLLGSLWVAYIVSLGVWRIFFSPIASIPGPKLAALTYWYEFYYDIILPGKFVFHIRDLHTQYGPIIRISPHELHIYDPDYFHTVYASPSSGDRDRDAYHTAGLLVDGSILATADHDLHRKRRAALSPFFSMASTRRLLPLVGERVNMLLRRIEEQKGKGEVNLVHALSAFSNDVITEFCYGTSEHRIEAPGFDTSFYNIMMRTAGSVHAMRTVPILAKTIMKLPDFIAMRMGDLAGTIIQKRIVSKQVEAVRAGASKFDRQTIFHSILESNLPESEKSTERLVHEAIVLLGAGSHTVAWALTVASFHILSNLEILKSLKQELAQVKRNADGEIALGDLEKLPYLTAVLKEGLRLSYGASGRSPRSSPKAPLQYKNFTIPAGTPISINTIHMHQDSTIFPSPLSFKPERWLNDKDGKLEKYMFAFSAGSRICLGINLAWAELYLCLGGLFGNFGGKECQMDLDRGVLELFETDVSDVEPVSDLFFPIAKKESRGVRITVGG